MACCLDPKYSLVFSSILKRQGGPIYRVVVLAQEEVAVRGPRLHERDMWIEGAEPHRMCEPLKCDLPLSQPVLDPPATVPRFCHVGVHRESTVNDAGRRVYLATRIRQGPRAESQCPCVVLAQLGCTLSEPLQFDHFVGAGCDPPASGFCTHIASSGTCVC